MKKQRTANSSYKKLAVQWLSDPDNYQGFYKYILFYSPLEFFSKLVIQDTIILK